MKMQTKPLVVDVIEDDDMWLDVSTMTYYDKDSLEPLDKHETDLEKEIISICETYGITKYLDAELGPLEIKNIAKHFFELGLNARKEK